MRSHSLGFVLVAAAMGVGCATGVPASSLSAAPASYQAVGPTYATGPRPEVYGALVLPPRVAGCLVEGGVKGLVVLKETIDCLTNTIVPPPVVPVQLVAPAAAAPCLPAAPLKTASPCQPPQVPPARASAPGSNPCGSGYCAIAH